MKHTIKTIITSAMAAFATFFMVIYISCTKDKCSSVVCQNGGSCDNGNCTCTSAYEGTKCETAARNKFMRNWGAENMTASTATPAKFAVSIDAGSGSSEVVIKNFHNYFTSVTATISRDSITIPTQQVMGKIVVGAGYIYSTSVYAQNTTISINYTVTDVVTRVTNTETQIWNG